MKLITRQDLANGAAERWRNQYRERLDTIMVFGNQPPRIIAEKLQTLGASPSIDDVNHAIGNTSWTTLTCSHCHESAQCVVAVDVTHGEYSTHICGSCVDKMKALFQ